MDRPQLRMSLRNARQEGARVAQALYARLVARLTLVALAIGRIGQHARSDWVPRIAHLAAHLRAASGSGSSSRWGRWRLPVLVTLTVLSVLVASLLPPLLSLRDAFADYQQLRALGVDGY